MPHRGVWLCSWRTVTGRPTCPYPAVVEEAICFGWIDSTASRLDDERGVQLLTSAQGEEHVDAAESTASGGHGGRRADDRCRPSHR